MLNRRNFLFQSAAVAGAGAAVATKAQAAQMEQTAQALDAIVTTVAWQEVAGKVSLDARLRGLIEAAGLSALGSQAALTKSLQHSLQLGLKPVELQEAIVQSSPYAGAGRAMDALVVLKKVLAQAGIACDFLEQGTVTAQTRMEKGLAAQTGIFGDAINRMIASLAPEEKLISYDLLTGHCFGDFYTRGSLTLSERELLTFVSIASLGGCDPQVRAHVGGCRQMGHSRERLLEVVAVLAPWIGFPKTLNAVAAINAVLKPQAG